ncbi:tetratricopeptide repeat-containing diguanylate cyclase [Massilia antarctica]|uniref:tetratricopeptide repeat-containing diguanylate cyclase n=1 Tax=Massilia antarctica TaxID=2765360 RepID=UPI0006BB5C13|nr:diguanylate cyclase [Massilia sp. H27-R4]MCY0911168.1 diguanylate cyclase [Massilia sp. H27-R4]CUI05245.1 diguanylate cyclase/phosphodiesterase (GGDEF & EAL domains) with PAS/PAC sensor(s) [Janthinobacterium sp. CG23_2]CUU29031.1 diguanylate cyclase/phosphodiesterase (GGDEF & EAL domains) with PAS/PAC sensor(s) [Janthinobacterium sp. CG23_2]
MSGLSDTSHGRKVRVLLASLWLGSCLAHAQHPVLDARLVEIREMNRYVPPKALAALRQIESEARAAPVRTKADFLVQLCLALRGMNKVPEALAAAEELIAFGRDKKDNVVSAKGLLTKAYVVSRMDQLALSHQLAWEGEKIANTTDDLALRVQAAITSGQAYSEDGNFPAAMAKMQTALTLARQYGQPIPKVQALNALAFLYGQLNEHDKGFEALDEATALAEQTHSPGRLASLKDTEYGLAVETNQPQRGLRALLAGLAYERQIGAEAMIAGTLVNLSDSYLKQRDYARTLSYATQALQAARQLNDNSTAATAHLNLGQAHLGLGSLAEGKRHFELGLAWYEKVGDKPELQEVLVEYGAALERAGDMAGAVKAYHRERTLSNELFEKRRQKATLELQEKYETEKKQRQIELLSRENQLKSTEIDNRRLQQRVWWLLAVVFALAALVVGILYRKVRHANAQLKVKNLELKQQSSRDPLTGLYNRRHFQEFMRSHLQVEKRGAGTSGEEIVGALFLLDVDHFKHVNDSHGHAAGDAVLKMIAESLREILRETDMIVRWGGEEFLAFLPAIPRSGVEEIARRLLTGISNQSIDYQDKKLSVNVSIGFAPFPLVPGTHALPWERAVNLVDMALYLAKAHGRNRAYGVRGFANFEQTSMEDIEQDLERAWGAGYVDMSIVLGTWPETKNPAAPPKLTIV